MQKFANIITTTNGFQVLCSIKQADEDSGYVISFETPIDEKDLSTIEMKLPIPIGKEESVLKKILQYENEDADALRDSILNILKDDPVVKTLNMNPSKS